MGGQRQRLGVGAQIRLADDGAQRGQEFGLAHPGLPTLSTTMPAMNTQSSSSTEVARQ